MGFSIGTGVPVITVFIQGLLSFFSPCVLPLVPLYISYLAGGARTVDENGRVTYPRSRVMVNTLFFVLGISFTFFVLGFGFSALGAFFSNNRAWFARVSGIIMVLFGLYQLGALGHSNTIEREHRLPFNLSRFTMNPLVALVLGFTFSFAWTPCVGPTLGSVLLMVSSAGQKTQGLWLIGVYTLGFVIPFLAVGLFTGTVLDFFKNHQSVVRYTVKVGGALLILMGVMTFTGYMNGITSYLSSFGGSGAPKTEQTAPKTPGGSENAGQPEGDSGMAADGQKDVYKRQEFKSGNREERLPGYEADFPYIASRVDTGRLAGAQSPWHWHREAELFYVKKGTLRSVSYTHLDVYKRQMENRMDLKPWSTSFLASRASPSASLALALT